jgi:chromosome partitioning related protein ParA
VEVLTEGTVTHLSISRTSVFNLDLVRSNDGEAQLQHGLHGREDRRSRIAGALNNPYGRDHHGFVLIAVPLGALCSLTCPRSPL